MSACCHPVRSNPTTALLVAQLLTTLAERSFVAVKTPHPCVVHSEGYIGMRDE